MSSRPTTPPSHQQRTSDAIPKATPSKNVTSAFDRSGSKDFSQPNTDNIVRKELLKNKGTINICDGLRALLHQCLATNPLYTTLDERVTKLEDELENINNPNFLRREEANILPSGMDVNSKGRVASPDFDPCRLSEARGKRDAMLRQVYNEEVLPAVIEAANDSRIRQYLEAFGAVLEQAGSSESSLYEPYINLCHAALDHFRDVKKPSLPDSNTSLDIRFMANPNRCLTSLPVRPSREGTITRKPDIICSSRAVQQVFETTQRSKARAKTPTPNMAWAHVLHCVEVKRVSTASPQIPDRTKNFEETPFRMPGACPVTWGPSNQDQKAPKRSSAPTAASNQFSGIRSNHPSSKASTPPKWETAGEAQTGAYGLTMLSHSQGVKHVINILLADQQARIMFINRQSILMTKPFNILEEFPHFLGMLFLFQRFALKNWGIIPTLNPATVAALEGRTELSGRITLDFKNDCRNPWVSNPTSSVVISEDYLGHRPCTLLGRATGVRPAYLEALCEEKLVCKIYNPEVARHHEGEILVALHAIADQVDSSMHRHLPTLRAYTDVADTDTRWLLSLFYENIKGHRVTRIVVLEELQPLQDTLKGPTEEDRNGETFIKAWLDVVKCHAFLWKHLVEHGDPSLNNVMFNPRLRCGVLIDFDLAVFRWGPRVPGTDRTGTIPFMAWRLLCDEYWKGDVVRQYFDELEALCWILPFVWLAGHKPDSPIDDWKTNDYLVCAMHKLQFLHSVVNNREQWLDEFNPKPTQGFVLDVILYVILEGRDKWTAMIRPFTTVERRAILDNPQTYVDYGQAFLDLFLKLLTRYQDGLVPAGYVDAFPKPMFAEASQEDMDRIRGLTGAL